MALTKKYSIEIEGRQAEATVSQIKEQIRLLEVEIDNATLGTKELEEKMLQLGRAKGALKELDDAVDALDPKAQTGAYLDFASGITGAFGIATVAAESFGLAGAGSAEEVEKKFLQLMTVMQAFDAIHKALNSETQAALKNLLSATGSNIKSILGLGNGWTLASIKAKLFGTTTKAALTATGIGIFIVLLGTVIANWDAITGSVGRFGDKMKNMFPGVLKLVDTLLSGLRNVASFVSGGLIDDAVTAASKKVTAAEAKMLENRIANRKRRIAEEEAAGRSSYVMKQQQLADELKLLQLQDKKETEEYKDKLSEIRTLKNSHDKSLSDRDDKAAKEAADKRKAAADKYKEQTAKEAEAAYNAMRKAEANEYVAREAARNRRYIMAKSMGARETVLLQIELNNLTENQQDLLEQGLRYSDKWYELEAQKLEKTKAIHAAEKVEDEKAKADREAAYQKDLEDQEAAYQKQRVLLTKRNATTEEFTKLELDHLKGKAVALEKAGKEFTKEYEDIITAITEIESKTVKKESGILQKIFDGLFGHLSPEQQEAVKKQLEDIVRNSLYVMDSLLEEAFIKLDTQAAVLDQRLTDLKDRNAELDEQLNETLQRRQDLESELDNARGSRREYLIQMISRERQEEAKLTAEKKKKAAEEARIAKQKEALELKRQELEAKGRLAQEAGIAISQAAAAFDAVAAAVAAIKAGAGVAFPGNLVAIASGIAAVAGAVVSAKKLAATVKQAKFEEGGSPNEVSGLVQGPSHAEGGVPFTVKGKPGYEMEGDEFIVRKSAYANNRETIQRINAIGNSVRFVAVPEHQVRRRAQGGESASGAGAASVGVAVSGDGVTPADLEMIRAVLLKIETNTARTADKDFSVSLDPWISNKIVNMAESVKKDEESARLF